MPKRLIDDALWARIEPSLPQPPRRRFKNTGRPRVPDRAALTGAAEREVEGVVEMMLDATQNFRKPLAEERLFAWHSALFPTGRSGMRKIIVGA